MGDNTKCSYGVGNCKRPRAIKKNGQPHRFCERHRQQANATQRNVDRRRSRLAKARRFAPYENLLLASRVNGLQRMNSNAGDLIVDTQLQGLTDQPFTNLLSHPEHSQQALKAAATSSWLPRGVSTFDKSYMDMNGKSNGLSQRSMGINNMLDYPAVQSYVNMQQALAQQNPASVANHPMFNTNVALQVRSMRRVDSPAGELILGKHMINAVKKSSPSMVAIAELAEQGLLKEAGDLANYLEEEDYEAVVPIFDVKDLDLDVNVVGGEVKPVAESTYNGPAGKKSADYYDPFTPNTSMHELSLDPLSASTLDLLVSIASFRVLNSALPA